MVKDMKRVKWHETVGVARKHRKDIDPHGHNGIHVFKWRFTKRAKPFFVGTEIEWLNV